MNVKALQLQWLRRKPRFFCPEVERIMKEGDKYAKWDLWLQVGALWMARTIGAGCYAAISLQENTYHGWGWFGFGLRLAFVYGFMITLSWRKNTQPKNAIPAD